MNTAIAALQQYRIGNGRRLKQPFAAVIVGMLLALSIPVAHAEEAWIVLKAPGLEGATPKVRVSKKDFQITERGVWQASASKWPRAKILFARIDDLLHGHYIFTRGDPLSKIVTGWFRGETVRLGEQGTAINRFDELEFQRFTRHNSVPCIFVRQGRDTTGGLPDLIGPEEPIGDLKIMGWYCAAPGTGDLDTVFAGFVNGIGIEGFADPELPHPDSKLQRRR